MQWWPSIAVFLPWTFFFSLVCSQSSPTVPASIEVCPTAGADGRLYPGGITQPTNNVTSSQNMSFGIEIDSGGMNITMALVALMLMASKNSPSSSNLFCKGSVVPFTADSQQLQYNDIPLISCDDEYEAGSLVQAVNSDQNPCILLYSEHSAGCAVPGASCNAIQAQLGSVFTVTSQSSGASIISWASNSSNVMGYIVPNPVTSSVNSSGPAESRHYRTSAATGVLYGIAGLVAAAFLFIIVSGAVRMHRHPERYGLIPADRNNDPRFGGPAATSPTSRAKGLARAVLDSIPLVRLRAAPDAQTDSEKDSVHHVFNKDESTDRKSSELVNHQHTHNDQSWDGDSKSVTSEKSDGRKTSPQDMVMSPENEAVCPICFEQLETGDIVRVLPCNHIFHALCVDPWLLNSSTLCPLCRVDLSIMNNEDISDQPPQQEQNESHQSDTPTHMSFFNRFLDTWNAQLLPREARHAALDRLHRESELRQAHLRRRDSTYVAQNQRRWSMFVRSRRKWHARNRQQDEHEQHAQSDDHDETNNGHDRR